MFNKDTLLNPYVAWVAIAVLVLHYLCNCCGSVFNNCGKCDNDGCCGRCDRDDCCGRCDRDDHCCR